MGHIWPVKGCNLAVKIKEKYDYKHHTNSLTILISQLIKYCLTILTGLITGIACSHVRLPICLSIWVLTCELKKQKKTRDKSN